MELKLKLSSIILGLMTISLFYRNALQVNNGSYPPVDERNSLDERDDCINSQPHYSCNELEGKEIEHCKQVQQKAEAIYEPQGEKQSRACRKLDQFIDYDDHTLPLPDVYFQCVDDIKKEAIKDGFYYYHIFKVEFEDCAVKKHLI